MSVTDGRWWKRNGYVAFMPLRHDPNIPGVETGWEWISDAEARQVLEECRKKQRELDAKVRLPRQCHL